MNLVMQFSSLIMPLMICMITIYALIKKTGVFDSFIEGGCDGLKNAVLTEYYNLIANRSYEQDFDCDEYDYDDLDMEE